MGVRYLKPSGQDENEKQGSSPEYETCNIEGGEMAILPASATEAQLNPSGPPRDDRPRGRES